MMAVATSLVAENQAARRSEWTKITDWDEVQLST